MNDSDEQADLLADLMDGFRAHVNLIPYNAIGAGVSGVVYARPSRRTRRAASSTSSATAASSRTSASPAATTSSAACGQLRETMVHTVVVATPASRSMAHRSRVLASHRPRRRRLHYGQSVAQLTLETRRPRHRQLPGRGRRSYLQFAQDSALREACGLLVRIDLHLAPSSSTLRFAADLHGHERAEQQQHHDHFHCILLIGDRAADACRYGDVMQGGATAELG